MQTGKTLAIAVLASIVGITASQASFASADDSANPFTALWDAINALSNKMDSLQAQIDELRAERAAQPAPTNIAASQASQPFVTIEVENGRIAPGQTLFHVVVSNAGPQSAAGVKLTAFYKMQLFDIVSISEQQCEVLPRGIIECYLGTIEANTQKVVTIDATARELGQETIVVADISSITEDSVKGDNHAVRTFVTEASLPVALVEESTTAPVVEQAPAVQEQLQEEEQPEQEQNAQQAEQAQSEQEQQEEEKAEEPEQENGSDNSDQSSDKGEQDNSTENHNSDSGNDSGSESGEEQSEQ